MQFLSGPRLDPEQGPATALVVFLHGYGANGADLIDIGASWAPFLPGVAFSSPNAPEICGIGYQWFPLTMRNDEERWHGVNKAAPVLDAFLDAELERTGVAPERLVLVGFSQGTMMALHVGPRRKVAPAAIVGYSGCLAGAEHLGETTVKPPVLLVHGVEDDVLPAQSSKLAADAFTAVGVPVSLHFSPGLRHGIDRMGMILGLRAIATGLGVELPGSRAELARMAD